MAIAQTQQGLLTIVGAPRYKHQGLVLAVEARGTSQRIQPYPKQVRAINAGDIVPPLLSTGHLFILLSLCHCDSDWCIFRSSCLCHESGQRHHHRPHSHICPHVHRRGQAGEGVHLHPIWFGKCLPVLLNMVKLLMPLLTLVRLLPPES